MTFDFVPDVPLVECDFEGFGGQTEIDPIDLGEVNERFTYFDIPLSCLWGQWLSHQRGENLQQVRKHCSRTLAL